MVEDKDMYQPIWDGIIERFAKKVIAKNLWRVLKYGYEYDDLYCESYLVFLKCKEKFTGSNIKMFMAYFKKSLLNRLCSISLKVKEYNEYIIDKNVHEMEIESEDNQDFWEILKNVPKEIQMVVDLILECPSEILDMVGAKKKKRRWSHNNKLLCSMLGIDHKRHDLIYEIKNYFTNV